MNLKRKSRAGQGEGDCGSLPDTEAHYWRLVVLLGLGILICAIPALCHLGERFSRPVTPNPRIDDRIVWTTGLPDGEGLCKMDWLVAVNGTPTGPLPRLATIDFTEKQLTIVSSIHPRAALLFLQPIPLNLADAEVLAALPGIGPALAARIVGKREELGGFQSLAQLRQVRGIGGKTLENIQGRLTL